MHLTKDIEHVNLCGILWYIHLHLNFIFIFKQFPTSFPTLYKFIL